MLKKLINETLCTLRITTTGPLLVKSGHASVSGPDMTPVLTFRGSQQEVFIPGSSLKGVFRSHSEKVVGSLQPHMACYPFESNSQERPVDMEQRQKDFRDSCGGVFTQYARRHRDHLETITDRVYAASCPICRLFGSTGGASHGAKFEMEVVSVGVEFETEIHLRNFEIWQLGLLFVILQDLEDELIHISSGRSRGLGKIKATISERATGRRPGGFVTSTMRASQEPESELWGLGRWLNEPEEQGYSTRPDDLLVLRKPVQRTERSIRSMRAFSEPAALEALRQAATENFIVRIQAWPQEVLQLPEPVRR